MKLTKKALKAIDHNNRIIGRLITECNVSYPTVRRWINKNHEKLTTASALTIICEELKTPQEDILTK